MTEKEIEACLQKQLSILESAYIVLLVSPDNMEDGWKIHSDRDRFKYKFRKFQDPTRLINTISCLMVDKVRIKCPYRDPYENPCGTATVGAIESVQNSFNNYFQPKLFIIDCWTPRPDKGPCFEALDGSHR